MTTRMEPTLFHINTYVEMLDFVSVRRKPSRKRKRHSKPIRESQNRITKVLSNLAMALFVNISGLPHFGEAVQRCECACVLSAQVAEQRRVGI
jgi:hypothetical protein